MSIRFQYNTIAAYTPDANPYTFVQIVAPTNQPVTLRAIEMMPLGSTGASVPQLYDLIVQTNATGLAAEATGVIKHQPAGSETIQTVINARSAGALEPTASGLALFKFSIHQQSSRLWIPPTDNGKIIIPGGVRLGIRSISGVFVAAQLSLSLEE
jgi:hypothetical protein